MTTEINYNHHWLRKWLRGEPHLFIGGREDPYLLRWYVIPRNHRFNIYLHKFCRSDDDRALHDHPWDFWSFILKGRYWEHTNQASLVEPKTGRKIPIKFKTIRYRFSLAHRRAEHAHRVELLRDAHGAEIPVWTFFVTTAKRREWGFHCPRGWMHWEKFTTGTKGEKSLGCGEFA